MKTPGNATHGSEWILQAQPTQGMPRIPRSCFLFPRGAREERTNKKVRRVSARRLGLNDPLPRLWESCRNTTHGSGWIVQVLPTRRAARPFLESHPREWVDRSGAAYNGGGRPSDLVIFLPSRCQEERQNGTSGAPLFRLDLNDPPTAVGGIPGSSARPSSVGWT